MRYSVMRWTYAEKGRVLEAFGRHIGHPVTVRMFGKRETVNDDTLARLKALADRIVSEG